MLRSALSGLRAAVRERAGQWIDRARAQAGHAVPAGWLDPATAMEFLAKVRDGQLPPGMERVSGQVQRLGERAFSRMLSRWPALGELVAEPVNALRRRKRVSSKRAERATNAPTVLDEPALEVLVAQLVAAPHWQSRVSAARALAHLDGAGVVSALTRALRDTSAEVAIAAIDALARRPDSTSLEALRQVVDNLDGFFSPVTRVAAVSALGRLVGDAELGPIMARVHDVEAEVSIAAISVVADRNAAVAAEHLVPVLRDGSGYFLPLVRLAAANALVRAEALELRVAQELLEREGPGPVRRVLERAVQCPPG